MSNYISRLFILACVTVEFFVYILLHLSKVMCTCCGMDFHFTLMLNISALYVNFFPLYFLEKASGKGQSNISAPLHFKM